MINDIFIERFFVRLPGHGRRNALPFSLRNTKKREFFYLFFFIYVIQNCFICRPSDYTLSEDAVIQHRTDATSASTVGRSNHSDRSHPRHSARFHPEYDNFSFWEVPVKKGAGMFASRFWGNVEHSKFWQQNTISDHELISTKFYSYTLVYFTIIGI